MVLYGWILIFGGAKSREKLGEEKEGTADTSLTEIQFITNTKSRDMALPTKGGLKIMTLQTIYFL